MMKERIDTERRPAGEEEEEGGLCFSFSLISGTNIPVAKEQTKIIDEADSGFHLQMQTAARRRTLASGGSHSGKKGFVA